MTVYTEEQIKTMWPQAEGELRGFANHLRRTNAGITAAQLEMALQLASERHKQIAGEKARPKDS